MSLRVVAVSDTHNHGYALEKLPAADVLVHAGDACIYGTTKEYTKHVNWLEAASHKYKYVIYVPGNHDKMFDGDDEETAARMMIKRPNIHILTEASIVIEDFTIYGCSHTLPIGRPWYYYRTEDQMEKHWDHLAIGKPEGYHLLVTHDPPYRVGDKVANDWHHWPFVGCKALRAYVEATQPLAHVFGHIHEGYGIYEGRQTSLIGLDNLPVRTTFVNAAIRDEKYHLKNSPFLLVFDKIEDQWELTAVDQTEDLL